MLWFPSDSINKQVNNKKSKNKYQALKATRKKTKESIEEQKWELSQIFNKKSCKLEDNGTNILID